MLLLCINNDDWDSMFCFVGVWNEGLTSRTHSSTSSAFSVRSINSTARISSLSSMLTSSGVCSSSSDRPLCVKMNWRLGLLAEFASFVASTLQRSWSHRPSSRLLHAFCKRAEQTRKFSLARDLEEKLGAITTDNFDDDVGHLTVFIVLEFSFWCLVLPNYSALPTAVQLDERK